MALNTRIVITGQDRGASKAFSNLGKSSTSAQRKVFGVNSALKTTDNSLQGFSSTLKGIVGVGGGLGLLVTALGTVKESLAIKIDFDRINNTLKAVTGTTANAKGEMGFLANEAKRLGLELRPLAGTYTRLLASTKLIGLKTEDTREIFTGFSEALTTFGAGREQSIRVFSAIEQIASKGVVSMEELRQQLGESLPGALSVAARSMKLTEQEFIKLVSQGKVLSKDFLLPFAREAKETLGKGAVEGAKLLQAQLNRLTNSSEQLFLAFAQGQGGVGGFVGGFAEGIKELTGALDEGGVASKISDIGSQLGIAFASGTKAILGLTKSLQGLLSVVTSPSFGLIASFIGARSLGGLRSIGGARGVASVAASASSAGGVVSGGSAFDNARKLAGSGSNTFERGQSGGTPFVASAATRYYTKVLPKAINTTSKFSTIMAKSAKGVAFAGKGIARSLSNVAGGPLALFAAGLIGTLAIMNEFKSIEARRKQAEQAGDKSGVRTRAFNRREDINRLAGNSPLGEIGDVKRKIALFEQAIENSAATFGKLSSEADPIFREGLSRWQTRLKELTSKSGDPFGAFNKVLGDVNKLFFEATNRNQAKFIKGLDKESKNIEIESKFREKFSKERVDTLQAYNKIIKQATKEGRNVNDPTLQASARRQALASTPGASGSTKFFNPLSSLNATSGVRALALQSGVSTKGKSKEQRDKELLASIKIQNKLLKEQADSAKEVAETQKNIHDMLQSFQVGVL